VERHRSGGGGSPAGGQRWSQAPRPLLKPSSYLNSQTPTRAHAQVHKGFLTAYDSVRPQVFRLLDAIIASGDEGTASAGDWHVYVTGHSLGGALATLCAYELATRECVPSSFFFFLFPFPVSCPHPPAAPARRQPPARLCRRPLAAAAVHPLPHTHTHALSPPP
jgi:surfactin synthase thioesterase subunit